MNTRGKITHGLAGRQMLLLALAAALRYTPVSGEVVGLFTFDGSLSNRIEKTTIQAKLDGAPTFGAGRRGKSLSMGMALPQMLRVSVGNDALKTEGTAEFWISLPQSRGTDAAFPFRLQLAIAEDFDLLVNKDPDASTLACHIRQKGTSRHLFVPVYDWPKAAWQHILVAWKGGQARFYVNRQLAADCGDASAPAPATPHVAPFQLVIAATGPVAVEDLFIYDHALTTAQVEEQFINSCRKEKNYEPPIIRIPYAARPPIREGKIDPEAWASAAVVGDFAGNGDGVRTSRQTWIHLMYDDQRLYLLYQAPIYDGAPAASGPNARDVIPQGDSIEFFIMPKYTETFDYFQFIGSPWGSFYDGVVRDSSWDGDWFYRCSLTAEWWLAELWIDGLAPFSASAPAEGGAWSMNFCRNWESGAIAPNEKFTQWSPSGAYHNHRLFGKVVFGGRATIVPQVQSMADTEAELGTLSARLTLLNTGTQPMQARVVYTFYARGDYVPLSSTRQVVSVPPGHKTPLVLTHKPGVPLKGIAEIVASSPDARDVYLHQMVKIGSSGK